MAPPSSRRSGFSKKAQYSLFTGYLLAGAMALLGLALLMLSLWQPSAFAPLRGLAGDVVAPAGEATAVARSGQQGLFSGIAGYFRAGSQNAALREEMELARIRLAELRLDAETWVAWLHLNTLLINTLTRPWLPQPASPAAASDADCAVSRGSSTG